MAGKGDKKRPLSEKFLSEYERVFGDKCRLNHKHTKECKGFTNTPTQTSGQLGT